MGQQVSLKDDKVHVLPKIHYKEMGQVFGMKPDALSPMLEIPSLHFTLERGKTISCTVP